MPAERPEIVITTRREANRPAYSTTPCKRTWPFQGPEATTGTDKATTRSACTNRYMNAGRQKEIES